MTVSRPIRFFHRGQVVEVDGLPPTTSVLSWLREHARCTGTKEGCNEGDCGACTVVVAELSTDTPTAQTGATRVGELLLRPVNACIRFLPTLDGRALLTVEDLQSIAAAATPAPQAASLHPVQQALVDCHGSQCGFCTPGFAMTLTALYEDHCEQRSRPSRRQVADALAGNLCRCTGYRPILEAGQRMFELPPRRLDTAPIAAALRAMSAGPALHYQGPAASGNGAMQSLAAPRRLDELAALRVQQPEARLLAGCTDIGLWVNKQFRELGDILYLGEVAELKTVSLVDGWLAIGAAAPLEDAWRALAAQVPSLTEMGVRFAGPPVRHAGTLVGNLANGSPIGDAAPVLMCLGARLLLRRGHQTRRVALDDFYLGYMKNRLEAGEFVQAVEVPLPPAGTQVRGYKLSKRYDCDISGLCAGLALSLADDGSVREARFAFGGMAAVVRRAVGAEAAVVGQPWSEVTARAAMAALERDFQPLSDLRASAAYRLKSASNLLLRLWLETRLQDPLPAAAVSVWADLEQGRGESAATSVLARSAP